MFKHMADRIKPYATKFQKFFINKYFWSIVATIVVLLASLAFMLHSGQNPRFQKAHQELIDLANNIRNYYKVRPDYWGLDTASALKNGLVPEAMLHDDKIINAIGRKIILGQDAEGNMVMPGQRNFMITMLNLSKTACIAIMSLPLKPEQHLGLLKISLENADGTEEFEWGGANPLPVTEKAAKQFCKNKNSVNWIFE